MDVLAPAATRLKLSFSRRSPPRKAASPNTRRRFPMMLPVSEAFTTSVWPSHSAMTPKMSSARFPRVALSRPPSVAPMCPASCSVPSPSKLASGTSAAAAAPKPITGWRCNALERAATGKRSKIETRQPPKENRIASLQAEEPGISLLSSSLRARHGPASARLVHATFSLVGLSVRLRRPLRRLRRRPGRRFVPRRHAGEPGRIVVEEGLVGRGHPNGFAELCVIDALDDAAKQPTGRWLFSSLLVEIDLAAFDRHVIPGNETGARIRPHGEAST